MLWLTKTLFSLAIVAIADAILMKTSIVKLPSLEEVGF